MAKTYRLQDDQLKPLVEGHSACFASDLITVEGMKVGYMYRDEPETEIDSGWRFLSGFESEEFINDPNNLAMHELNTIANYDRDILPFLSAPLGSAFERPNGKGSLVAVVD